ncbi:MAG TPA: hypothetical protein VNJ01_17500 [Bacteriovoracaceae bacterium]|nr:hypothetical protein [Bacteriovoracaceae bacterium]
MRNVRILAIIFGLIVSTGSSAEILPVEASTFEFNIRTPKLSREKEEKLLSAVDVLRAVYGSDEFRNGILNHKYKGRRTFSNNKGLSNAQVYQKIMDGVERLYPLKNNAMDLEVELFTNNFSKVLGFTRSNSSTIFINTKYFNKNTAAKIASNLTHEWLHKLGFTHPVNKCLSRRNSVPYAVGYLVKTISKKLGY